MLVMGELRFEWDGAKRDEVIAKLGVDLRNVARMFAFDVVTRVDDRADYGEQRLISIGMVDGICYVAVHTERNGVIRLITAWRGGRYEQEQYRALHTQRVAEDEEEGGDT